MHMIQNYTFKKMLLKNFAVGDGVASRDQESVRPSADDLDCRLPDSPTHRYGESIFDYEYLHKFEFES